MPGQVQPEDYIHVSIKSIYDRKLGKKEADLRIIKLPFRQTPVKKEKTQALKKINFYLGTYHDKVRKRFDIFDLQKRGSS